MAIIAVRRSVYKSSAAAWPLRSAGGRRALAACTALGAAVGFVGSGSVALASTIGNSGGLAGPDQVLSVMGINPPLFDAGGKPIAYTNALYGYVKNDYIGVVVGFDGQYAVPFFGTKNTVTHHSAGMITFGNQKGSLLTGFDDLQALCGLNRNELYVGTAPGVPEGYGVWPIPGWWENGTGVLYTDNSAYSRAQVDGKTINVVGGDPATNLVQPRFENNVLSARWRLLAGTGAVNGGAGTAGTGGLPAVTTPDVTIDQFVELYRATARIHWRLFNGDGKAHTVRLRFTVPVRDTASGFYYVDPLVGVTNQVNVIQGADLPDTLAVYGQRYDDPANTAIAPFAARQIFRGYGATLPTSLYISDQFDTRPNGGGFDPTDVGSRSSVLSTGITTNLYFGPYTLLPGGTQDIFTFYGNGRPTEDLKDDVVVATEATEAVTFNSAAAQDPKIVGNQQVISDPAQLAYAEQAFLLPNPITVQGSVYNRTLPQNSATLNGVTMSLILPPLGLTFATPPGGTAVDKATKAIGQVFPDTDAQATWYLQATGAAAGLLTYQLATTSNEIGSRTITRTINVPATPLHPVTNTTFQMIGFPFQFDQGATNQGDPATIINTLAPPSLRDNPAIFYYWVPSINSQGQDAGHYAVATSIQPGQGYFFRPAATRILFPYGAAPVSGQTPLNNSANLQAQKIQVILNPGWNMITNPYLYSIPLNILQVTQALDGQLNGSSTTFLNAASSGLVQGSVFFYDTATNAYDFFTFQPGQAPPTLDPWIGYWIYVNNKVIVTFPTPTTHNSFIKPSANGGEPATKGAIARNTWMVAGPTTNNWALQLVAARPGGRQDRTAVIGVKPGITTRNASLPKPPPPTTDYVYVGVNRPSDSMRCAYVFQQPGAGAKTFDFEVSSDKDGPVTLEWPNLATLPRQLSLTLRSMATGQTYSLHGQSSIQVPVRAGVISRFQIVARQQASTPLSIGALHIVHSRAAGADSSEIVFNLTQDAAVTAQVQTLAGKVVGQLESGRAAVVGETRLHWTGRNLNGAPLAPGIYQIKVRARNESGDTAESSVPYTSLR
jgi:hypothetical protein